MFATDLSALFTRDIIRLRQELDAYPDSASLWVTGPGVSNAAGTLALHLEGNLREYIGREIGGIDYTRDRAAEFRTRGVAKDDLLASIDAVARSIPPLIAGLSESDLDAVYPEAVLGRPWSTRQFLMHLSGHLNYHLGQIDYLRRLTTGAGAIALAGLE